ncbi:MULTISPECIES: hypothetical protein [Bifidobacterium]|uniref:Uncharacterized protein n=1 Tax=Bifidobacterium asteroides TaxID=1684 RepID=A0A556RCH9_9BIFI|nr:MULTISPECIES: hypothetical protein [Bifidobacterium]MBI0085944.1 hypothetical protein [Bifidobacterium sp. M0404]TSJ86594.1 hypothetical protein FPK29_02670 [Bifidobacterium polysaccharolyticum]
MRSKNTQATEPSGRKRVSGADVDVTGTAGALELTTTTQKPRIEQVQTGEDSSSLSTAELDQLTDQLNQILTKIKNTDPGTIPHFAENWVTS